MTAASYPATQVSVWGGRLSGTEIRRRFWHMSPGVLPFVLWGIDHHDPISFAFRTIAGTILVLLATLIFAFFRLVERPGERADRTGAVLGYAGSVAAALYLLPSQAEIGLTVLAILAFGDGSATLAGKLLRGPKLAWNSQKSWSGVIAFLVVGGSMASLVYWGETYFNAESQDPSPGLLASVMCCCAAVLASAIIETIPSKINDNIRVGVTAFVGLVASHAVVVGF
ncbi:MAG: hypothetical protein WD648_03165 [Planctomycetaceae bacterium]